MHTISDHINADLVIKQPPTDRARCAMMQRGHRVHEMRHVMCACVARSIKYLRRCASVTNRNHPTPPLKLSDQLNSSFDLRSNGHRMQADRAVNMHIDEAGKERRAFEINYGLVAWIICTRIEDALDAAILN